MFTTDQIAAAHAKVKSGADFPRYIEDIKRLGVTGFETRVTDSQTVYYGKDGYQASSQPMYAPLDIAAHSDTAAFARYLQQHQQGLTGYMDFCRHCAETGVEKWVVRLADMTCTYYDTAGHTVLTEQIPG